MPDLSSEQFDEDLAKRLREEGGFTVNVNTGRSPNTGFATSIHGHEEQIPGDAAPTDIRRYRTEHDEELQRPTSYFGAWKYGGTSFLDSSRHFETPGEAHEFGRRNAQIAFYDIAADKERLVHYGPPVESLPVANPLVEHRAATARKNAAHRGLIRQQLKARESGSHEEAMAEARKLGEAVFQTEQFGARGYRRTR